MKKFSMLFLAAAVALVGAIVAPNKAEAVPAFARQVGVPCYSCHYQHIPKLNAFGRDFKLGGFTQSAQDLIQDEGLSLPPVLNAAVVVKLRFIQSSPEIMDGNGNLKYGEWNLPDEAAILVGGRVGENMGSLHEFSGNGQMPNNKFVYSKDFGGVRGGVTVFATADAGPAYGMELFETGNQRNQFGYEVTQWHPRAAMSGPWNNGAQGLGFFAGSDLFLVNISLFAPAASSFGGGGNYDAGFNLSNYARVAITPKIGDIDLMVGASYTTGKTKVYTGQTTTKTDNSVTASSANTSTVTTTGTITAGAATVQGSSVVTPAASTTATVGANTVVTSNTPYTTTVTVDPTTGDATTTTTAYTTTVVTNGTSVTTNHPATTTTAAGGGTAATAGNTSTVTSPGGNTAAAAQSATTTSTTVTPGFDTEIATDSMMIDAQLQIPLGGMSLEVIANYATVKTDSLSAFNKEKNDAKGMSVGASLGLTKHAGVKLGYGSFDNGKATANTYTAMFLGGWYALAQNVDLTLDYCSATGDAKPFDSKMILMLEYVF